MNLVLKVVLLLYRFFENIFYGKGSWFLSHFWNNRVLVIIPPTNRWANETNLGPMAMLYLNINTMVMLTSTLTHFYVHNHNLEPQ